MQSPWVSLNYKTKQTLNYLSMKENILKELEDPQETRRQMNIVDKNFFYRDQITKGIRLIERVKRYGLVFDKRVVDRGTGKSYPYVYCRIRDDVELLLSL